MELKTQYAKRADGANTALGTMGNGPHLVLPPGWVSHLDEPVRLYEVHWREEG